MEHSEGYRVAGLSFWLQARTYWPLADILSSRDTAGDRLEDIAVRVSVVNFMTIHECM